MLCSSSSPLWLHESMGEEIDDWSEGWEEGYRVGRVREDMAVDGALEVAASDEG